MTTALLPKMTATISTDRKSWTAADLGERFGQMPLWRIRFSPMPGNATEEDVLNAYEKEGKLCELIDGVLVEKPMGWKESSLAITLATFLKLFALSRRLGTVAGPDGTIRLFPGMIRIPDVAYVSWDKLPGRCLPDAPIPDLVPDLAVEILSPSNTEEEMTRKRGEYFAHGVRLVWIVDPANRTVAVYTEPQTSTVLHVGQALDGDAVLPGFSLPLADLFAELDEQAPPAPV